MADRDPEMERRILRARLADLSARVDRLIRDPAGPAPELVQVFEQVAIPTTNKKYFAAHPVTPGGAEVEGGTPTFAADSGTIFVLPVGSRIPVVGDYLIAKAIGGRWVAESRGDSISVCGCSIPKTLHTGDGAGPVTLVWNPSTSVWEGSQSVGPFSIWWENFANGCVARGTGLVVVSYGLSLRCPNVINPGWTLSVRYRNYACRENPGDPLTEHYADTTPGASVSPGLGGATVTIPFTCDVASGLSFTMPTNYAIVGGSPLSGAVILWPGGTGGTYTVLP